MKKHFDILRKRSSGNILVAFIILFFAVMAIVRLYPFENSLQKIIDGPDDWRLYARFALDIKHNGLLMPSLYDNYVAPAGFLYNYFLALCFYLFGENTIPVFFIQNLLLGFSIAFVYWTFRDKMEPITGILFLLSLFLFALFDVSKYYSFRLLSENLAIFTISVFFYCFFKGIEKNKLSLQLLAAVFMGLSISVRPNILPFGIMLIVIMLFYFFRQKKIAFLNLFLFVFIIVIGASLLAIRNYFVCGGTAFVPTQGIVIGESYFHLQGFSLSFFLKKILFCLGILSPLEPEYQSRPHWVLMWIGYFIYLVLRIRENEKLEIWETTTHLFIFFYYGSLFLLAPQLGNYGFRLFLPAIFIILPFSFMVVDKLNKK